MRKHAKLGKDDRRLWSQSLLDLNAVMAGKGSKYWRRVEYPRPVAGEEVKGLRTTLQLTQLAFAQALGMSLSTIRSWEQGTKRPDGLARKVLRSAMEEPGLFRKLAKA